MPQRAVLGHLFLGLALEFRYFPVVWLTPQDRASPLQLSMVRVVTLLGETSGTSTS
jgi:hypothetical protein